LKPELPDLVAAVVAIPLSLLALATSVFATTYWPHANNPKLWPGMAVLTWGGVRGGIPWRWR
jgi:NhaP-type Na+/H+ or K+/H+ antiporter